MLRYGKPGSYCFQFQGTISVNPTGFGPGMSASVSVAGRSIWPLVAHLIRGLSMLLAVITVVVMSARVAHAQTYTVLNSFCRQANCSDGSNPAATFTVNSTGTAMTATVPNGATTGTVHVETTSGLLKSTAVYTVQ